MFMLIVIVLLNYYAEAIWKKKSNIHRISNVSDTENARLPRDRFLATLQNLHTRVFCVLFEIYSYVHQNIHRTNNVFFFQVFDSSPLYTLRFMRKQLLLVF